MNKKVGLLLLTLAVGGILPTHDAAASECNVAGCPGKEVPSLEAQRIAKEVATRMIMETPNLARNLVQGSKIELQWKVSPVPPLNFGVVYLDVRGPQNTIIHVPLRFYVADRGLDSLVISGVWLDANGKQADNEEIKVTKVETPQKDAASAKVDLSQLEWAVVHPGKKNVLLFTDPDCPFCARLRPKIVRMLKEHGDVKLSVIYTPLTSLHPNAWAKSKVLLSVRPAQRLRAEEILHGVNSGNEQELKDALEAKGIQIVPSLAAKAEERLNQGMQFAYKMGLGMSTPVVVFLDKRDAVNGDVDYNRLVSHL